MPTSPAGRSSMPPTCHFLLRAKKVLQLQVYITFALVAEWLLYSWRASWAVKRKQVLIHHKKRYGDPQMLRKCYLFAPSRNIRHAQLASKPCWEGHFGQLGTWRSGRGRLVSGTRRHGGLAVCTARISREVLSMRRADWPRAALEMIGTGVVLKLG